MPWTWLMPFLQFSATTTVAIAVLGYAYVTYHHGKWKELGVPHTDPAPVFGHLGDVILGRAPIVDVIQSLYKRFDGHPYFGVYEMREPVLVIRDAELVHIVMVRDFEAFRDRIANSVSFAHDKLFQHLANLRGDRWKAVRSKLSPAFSATKLKSMIADVNECMARFLAHLNERTADGDGIVDVSEAAAQLTTDIIGRCAFGLDCDSVSNPDSEFRRVGRVGFVPSRKTAIIDFMRFMGLGRILDLFRVRPLPDLIYNFFDDLLDKTIKQHEMGENTRNDFIALLVKLVNEEKLKKNEEKLFSNTILVSNVFVFFIAGFETTALTISYCLYELAMNQDIQNKLREKIKQTYDTNEEKLSYDAIKDMKYLDMVINETLRLHPPLPLIERVCTKKYTIPNSNITLNVGEKLYIPTYSLHYDPKYYPSPDIFDPERFTEENIALRSHGTFLPFGDGPRICIGLRFALMEIKIGLAEVLSNFEIMPCKDTKSPIKIKPRSIVLTPMEPIRLKLIKIK